MRILSLLVVGSFIFNCGDDDASDAGLRDAGAADARGADSGPADAAAPSDAADDVEADSPDVASFDASTSGDAGTDAAETDGGPDTGPDVGPVGLCVGLEIGRECPCTDAFLCVDGRCVPGRRRATCGGFAGDVCTTRAFPECTFSVGSDFGPCLSTSEQACVCSEHRDLYACDEMRE
ncbi:MAG: hypothetical protein ACI9KE_001436 [Polyangiales bacterium]|jgi:hypothetical protein